MIVYVNDKNEIKAVGVTSDSSLTAIEILDGTLDGWSEEKICCYKINVVDGRVTMLTPYVDSRDIEHYDRLSNATAEVKTAVGSNYDPQRTYSQDEYCMYNGNLYRFLVSKGRGVEPTDKRHWELCDIASELNRIMRLIKEA